MNKKTTRIALPLLVVPLLSLGSCGAGASSSIVIDDTYYSKVSERAGFDDENGLNFDQTMENGLDDSVWYTLDGAWHTTVAGWAHNGVRSRNLFYTKKDDTTYLAMKGRGYYNTEDPANLNKPEGACIVTKNHLTPGRYEIKMSALPHSGAVTAMWSYCTTTGNEATSQNEIDIEIGGTTDGTQFANMWCTSWTKKETKQTDTVDVTDRLYLNDGKIHKYTFDWYTDYAKTGKRRVDWFIDEHYIDSIEGNVVPETEMPLWVGVWFPPAWAGNPDFVEDYMLVEEINFTAFDSTQYVDSCRSEPGYTKKKPSEAGIKTIDYSSTKVNKLSNGDMDSLEVSDRDSSYYGWIEQSGTGKGSIALTQDTRSGSGKAFELSSGDKGEYVYQRINNAYSGFSYDLKIDAKLKDASSSGKIYIYARGIGGTGVLYSKTIPIDSTDFKTYSEAIAMPEGSAVLDVYISSESGSVIYDSASLY